MISSYTERALLGTACGDAFGAPFEYHENAYDLARKSLSEQRYLAHTDVKVDPNRSRVTGIWTDDTQQSRLLVLAKNKGLNAIEARDFFRSKCRLMLKSGGSPHGTHRGTGHNFRESIRTGFSLDTAGLGASMRVAPVATMFDDPNEMIMWVGYVNSTTTHNTISHACAIKVALAAWVLSHPGERDKIKGLKYPDHVGYLDSNGWCKRAFTSDVWKATVDALIAAKGSESALLEYGSQSPWTNRPLDNVADGFALTGFAWAIVSAFTATSFEMAMDMAASPGGDTDTICAITGALAAMRFEVPSWMASLLREEPTEGLTDFREFNRIEYKLTRRETKLRAELVKAAKV